MTIQQQLQNYVQTTLASACTSGATTISVVSASGLPTAGNFMLRIDDASPATTFEYVECTGVSGTTLTVTRGQEGTTGIAHGAGAFVGNDITAAMLIRAFPGGLLLNGKAQVTTSQGSITTLTDLTGLTITVTIPTSRQIEVSGQIFVESTVADDIVALNIQEGATQLGSAQVGCRIVGQPYSVSVSVFLTPTAGIHTYKLTCDRAVGTGTVTMVALATVPAYIVGEDIGSA